MAFLQQPLPLEIGEDALFPGFIDFVVLAPSPGADCFRFRVHGKQLERLAEYDIHWADMRLTFADGVSQDIPIGQFRNTLLGGRRLVGAVEGDADPQSFIPWLIDRHRADFLDLLDKGQIDILFSNEAEICSLAQVDDFEAAVATVAAKLPTLVVTRSEKGAIAIHDGQRYAVAAEPIDKVVDTTGAGDLFAAGFLAGQAQGRDVETSLRMGAIAAAEIISHFGARSSVDLKALVAQKLG